MSSLTNRSPRHAFAEFSQEIGKDMIHVRLFKERVGFLCEREWWNPMEPHSRKCYLFINDYDPGIFHNDPHYDISKRNVKIDGKVCVGDHQ